VSEINFSPSIRSRTILVAPGPLDVFEFFREGEVATGRVIGQIDPRHAILRFKGHNLLVESQIPLAEREELSFRVESTSPQVVLRLLPELMGKGTPAGWLKNYVSYDIPGKDWVKILSMFSRMEPETVPSGVRDTVQDLLKLLGSFSMEALSRDPASIEEAITRSGLFFESRLKRLLEEGPGKEMDLLLKGDLKGLLLKLRAGLNASQGLAGTSHRQEDALIDELAKGADQFIHKLELYQLLNLFETDLHERAFLLLPLLFPKDPRFLELTLGLPRRGSKEEEEGPVSLLFLLDLPELGSLKIEVKMNGKNLLCLFRVPDPEASKFMEEGLSELRDRLSGLGFQSQIHVSAEPLTEEHPSPVGELGAEMTSLLSVVV